MISRYRQAINFNLHVFIHLKLLSRQFHHAASSFKMTHLSSRSTMMRAICFMPDKMCMQTTTTDLCQFIYSTSHLVTTTIEYVFFFVSVENDEKFSVIERRKLCLEAM